VWRDTADLWPGEDWRAKIRQAITGNALVFIACFSRKAVERSKTYQREELLLGIDQLRLRRPDVPWLIPVRFDECIIPDYDLGGGRTLASIQRVDLFGTRSDESARRLVTTVLRLLGRRSDASPVASTYRTTPRHADNFYPISQPDVGSVQGAGWSGISGSAATHVSHSRSSQPEIGRLGSGGTTGQHASQRSPRIAPAVSPAASPRTGRTQPSKSGKSQIGTRTTWILIAVASAALPLWIVPMITGSNGTSGGAGGGAITYVLGSIFLFFAAPYSLYRAFKKRA
jgi:hypothetical protein